REQLQVHAPGEVAVEVRRLDEAGDALECLRKRVLRIAAEEAGRPAVWTDQAEQDPHRRRLAGTVGPEKSVDVGGVHGEVDLIVEDDPELRAVLERGLEEESYHAEAVGSGGELLSRVGEAAPDALVIDIGLPDADGRDLCLALRARGLQTPVLFLTARDALVDRVAGFDAGGDDYLAKPFAFAELIRRLEALLRRAGGDGTLEAAGLRLDPVTHSVRGD